MPYRPRRNPAQTGVIVTVPGPTPDSLDQDQPELMRLSRESCSWQRVAHADTEFLLRCVADSEYPSGLLADVRAEAALSRELMLATAIQFAHAANERLCLLQDTLAKWEDAVPTQSPVPAERVTNVLDHANGVLVIETTPS